MTKRRRENYYAEHVRCVGKGWADIQTRSPTGKVSGYTTWHMMLVRCYDSNLHVKQPSYAGCSVCDEWLTFSNFKRWHDENYREGFHIDKDILVPGNKVYSPYTCRMVPQRINNLLIARGNDRGAYPLGVHCRQQGVGKWRGRTRFTAHVSLRGNKRLARNFHTPEEAQAWYAETKCRVVREVAQQALDAGEIQQDIFDALVARTFTDGDSSVA